MDSPSPLQPKFKKPAPYDRANFLLKAIVGYPAPTFIRGWRKGVIQVEDLYQSPKNDVVEKITRPLVRNWELQLQKRNNKGKPSFMLALARTFALCYLPPLLIYLFTEVALRVATPLLLGRVIRYFSGDREISYRDAWIYAGSLCLCTFLQLTINHPTMLHLKRLGMRLRVSCSAMLYQKSLKLSRAALGQTSVAQTVNIMSNDCNRFDEFSIWVPYIVIAPVHTIVSVYFVYKYIGVASFAGIAFLIGVIPYQSFMGRCFSTVRFKIAGLTDNRLRYLNEVISAIHVVKMYCWEQPFADKIAQARKAEVAQVQKACYLKAVNSSTFFVASKAVLFVCFLVYVLMGNVLNPEGVFVVMSLMNLARLTMTLFFPQAIGYGAELRESFYLKSIRHQPTTTAIISKQSTVKKVLGFIEN